MTTDPEEPVAHATMVLRPRSLLLSVSERMREHMAPLKDSPCSPSVH